MRAVDQNSTVQVVVGTVYPIHRAVERLSGPGRGN